MARRKKINSRVMVLLSVLGVVVLLGVVSLVIKQLPKDPKALAAKAEAYWEKGDYLQAAISYDEAARAAEQTSDEMAAEYWYQLALVQFDWAEKDPQLTRTSRVERLGAAQTCLDNALRSKPDHLEAQRRLCQFYWDSRFFRGYPEQASKLLRLDSTDHQTYFRRGRARGEIARATKAEDLDQAIADMRKATELKKDQIEYWAEMIQFLLSVDRIADAETAFDDAMAANPDNPEIRIEYGRYLWQRGKRDEAVAAIEEAIARAPDDTAGYVAMAGLLMMQGDSEEAFSRLEQAKALDPTEEDIYRLQAGIYGFRHEPAMAVEALREGLAVVVKKAEELAGTSEGQDDPEISRLRGARLILNFLLADVLLDMIKTNPEQQAELVAQAQECLDQMEKAQSDSPHGKKIAGRLALLEGDELKAISLLREAHERFLSSGGDTATVALLVSLYDKQKNPGEADRVLDEILTSPRFRRVPALLLAKAGREIRYLRNEKAESIVDEVLRIDPQNEKARELKNRLAAVRGELTVPAEGELPRQTFAGLLQRSQNLWVEERRAEAIAIMEDLLRRMPDEVRVHGKLADMYRQENRLQEAQAILVEAKRRFGDDEDIIAQIRMLEERDPDKRYQIGLAMIDKQWADHPFRGAIAKAMLAGSIRKYDDQLKWLEEAEKIDPESELLITAKFTHAIAVKDWQRAEELLESARQSQPQELEVLNLEFRLALARKEYEKAIETLKEILEQRPDLLIHRIALARGYSGIGDLENAKATLAEAVRRDPRMAIAIIELARVTEQLGQTKEHEQWVERAHELPEARQNPYIEEKWLQMKASGADPATISGVLIPIRERIVRKRPNGLQNRLYLALLYERVDRISAAERQYEYVFANAADKLAVANVLASFYVRTDRLGQVDQLFSKMVADAESAREKARVWVVWAGFLRRVSLDQAMKAVDTAINIDPEYPASYRDKSRYLAEQGKLAESVEMMKKYLQFEPEDAKTAEKDLVRTLINDGRFDEAGDRVSRILAEDPTDAYALTLKGFAAYKRGQRDKALELITHAVDMNPKASIPLRYRANIYIDRGELEHAKQDMLKAFQLTKDPGLLMSLAALYRSRGELPQAVKVYEQILADSPRNKLVIHELLMLYGKMRRWQQMESLVYQAQKAFPQDVIFRIAEGDMWVARRDQNKQIAAATEALRLAPQSEKVLDYYLRSVLDAGMLDEAEAVSLRYEADPRWTALMKASRAIVSARRGRAAEANALFAAAIAEAKTNQLDLISIRIVEVYGPEAPAKLAKWAVKRGGDPYVYLEVAKAYKSVATPETWRGNLTQAVNALQKAISLADSAAQKGVFYGEMGLIYGFLGQWDQAEQAYLTGLELTPNDPDILNNLAYIYVDVRDEPEKAKSYSQRAVSIAPNDPGMIDTYAWVLARMQQYEQAKSLLFKSLELSRTIPDARYHLAWVYEQTGESKIAMTQYNMALDMVQGRLPDDQLRVTIEQAIERLRAAEAGQE